MPLRHVNRYLTDTRRLRLTAEAVEAAVGEVRHGRGEGAGPVDCRVLLLGAGAGLLAMVALRAGAYHVTCVERQEGPFHSAAAGWNNGVCACMLPGGCISPRRAGR